MRTKRVSSIIKPRAGLSNHFQNEYESGTQNNYVVQYADVHMCGLDRFDGYRADVHIRGLDRFDSYCVDVGHTTTAAWWCGV